MKSVGSFGLVQYCFIYANSIVSFWTSASLLHFLFFISVSLFSFLLISFSITSASLSKEFPCAWGRATLGVVISGRPAGVVKVGMGWPMTSRFLPLNHYCLSVEFAGIQFVG